MPFRTRPDGRSEYVCPCGCGATTDTPDLPAALEWRGRRDRSRQEVEADWKIAHEPPVRSIGEWLGGTRQEEVTP
jgi:hypothetical protein